ncbi:MAG: leucine--tRNA ligase [Patescibacteria group bacterium]
MDYNPKEIEPKWQKYWEENGFYKAEDFSKKQKLFLLIEFPYPSGSGLHVGHCRSYSAMDAIARKKRMEGFNVLFPMGWDAFGLPTENYAIKTGIHPSVATAKNVANFTRQLKAMGFSFDWDREINTTDPKYYKWTQWIFLQLFKNDLAYQHEMPINWCPSCKIGLANEEVLSGKCERCGEIVEQRNIKQWMLRITKYADRLIDDLELVDFWEKIKTQQINWIGRSEGVEIDFKIGNSEDKIKVFTTRPDTLFGVTAMVLSPEHVLVDKLTQSDQKEEVKKYLKSSKDKTEFERIELDKEKTGVFIGSYCINPVNSEKIPIWIGDYVVGAYGGGAVMVVPAHDKRDYDFAKKYELEIREVISGGDISNEAYIGLGTLINSGKFNGLKSEEAKEKISSWIIENNLGKKAINYKLRDWIFSRQHYWGEPIPIIHCEKCGTVPVPEDELPVELPYVERYQPTDTGESPLATISEWVNTKCPKCGGEAKRETDTMPNWAGSSWYFMRYIDPNNDKVLADKKKLAYWAPVDWYNGGMEHTTLHLLYSRFWYKFLYDIGVSPNPEPYAKRTSHGVILAEDGAKMSKSVGNVINPEVVIEEFGADVLRIYEMFMGPFDQAIAWNTNGLKGVYRFLEKVWSLSLECKGNPKSSEEIMIALHRLNKKIDDDLESVKFNTPIAYFMEFINLAYSKKEEVGFDAIKKMTLLLAPFAPHITEELWKILGLKDSVHNQEWPKPDLDLMKEDKMTMIIQVNGKLRDKMEIALDMLEEEAQQKALSQEGVQRWIGDKKIKKTIFVQNELINFVI